MESTTNIQNPLDELLKGEPVEFGPRQQDSLIDPKDALYNNKKCTDRKERKYEKPEHRIMILLKAQCLTNKEIAEEVGYSEAEVSQILRAPWARERLLYEMQKVHEDTLQKLLQSAAMDSVFKMIEIRDGEKTPPAVAGNMCIALLDRFLGKPKQQVEVKSDHNNLANKDLTELDKEIEVLAKESNRLQGIYTA